MKSSSPIGLDILEVALVDAAVETFKAN